ncbi:Transcriptional regulator, contains XRE-family HTH domain [Tenacibaculum sp. MAR_2010_89]|uniref:helix-turn-helix domain-containing protein n=1 Tax=Tenacibaculum sp. MAR_2010_89 TaxID=1250198 RepID=UPI00089C8806|nr:XRE family transcriptional regulator [Tenacibaculum sp. MAR_2010_89]SEE49551.1 Transcriptional regulator, contains XRE-family HTH domain [Tenacibaculum sp. MAR_2010_89]
MDDFLIGIGKRIKEIRKKQNTTISNLASNAGVSNGLISRIENGRTIPSLPVFLELISALDIDASTFFEGIEKRTGAKYIHVKKEEQQLIEKEVEAKGFTYFQIFGKSMHAVGFEAVMLTVSPNSKREKVITDAWEFKYIIKGTCTYLIDTTEVIVSEGDSLYFNGRLPHVPVNTSDEDCIMLVLYFFSDNN